MTLPFDEMDHFRRKLHAKRAELANERDWIVENLNREANLLRQVAEALHRMAKLLEDAQFGRL